MNDILSRTVTFILAGGRGERLAPLTRDRSKPAVPFGDGHIIDFTLTNCLQSNLPHPLVITQYQSRHLTHHVGRWWLRQPVASGTASAAPVCLPAPEPHYMGSADALFRNIERLRQDTEHVLILSADHIYEMNYQDLLRFHVEHGADATVAAIVYPTPQARQFGILEVDESSRIVSFEEKPAHPKELPGQPGKVLASMGLYVFRRETFLDVFRHDAQNPDSQHDIGRNVLPELVGRNNLRAYPFEDYWKDVGTIDSYYQASMEWLSRLPNTHRLAGAKSIISPGVRIHHTAEVHDSILMPGAVVGAGARVRRAILDENVHVLPGAHVGDGTGICVVQANTTVSPEFARSRRGNSGSDYSSPKFVLQNLGFE